VSTYTPKPLKEEEQGNIRKGRKKTDFPLVYDWSPEVFKRKEGKKRKKGRLAFHFLYSNCRIGEKHAHKGGGFSPLQKKRGGGGKRTPFFFPHEGQIEGPPCGRR